MRDPASRTVDTQSTWLVRDAGDLPPEAIETWANLLLELAKQTDMEPRPKGRP
jgi:hypothetical protein